jgi:hypothetical protein
MDVLNHVANKVFPVFSNGDRLAGERLGRQRATSVDMSE